MTTTAPRLFFNTEEQQGIDSLIAKFGSGAFASPYRSTVPLISLVKDDYPLFDEIVRACARDAALAVHFEYQVKPAGVDANASHTDAMVYTPHAGVAVEAKWTEPRYEAVPTRFLNRVAQLSRLHPGKTAEHELAQKAVIEAWLNMLRPFSGRHIELDEASGIVYQMVHRAASAAASSQSPHLVYLHFEPSPRKGAATAKQYMDDLRALHELIGSPSGFPFYVVSLPTKPTAAFGEIEGLPKGTKDTDLRVRRALASSRLFEFGTPSIHPVA